MEVFANWDNHTYLFISRYICNSINKTVVEVYNAD